MPAPVNTTPPAILGDDSDQGVLSVVPGAWTDDRDYQWLADGVAIPGEKGASFTKSDAFAGKTITVRETVTNAAGSDEAVSAGVGPLEFTVPVNTVLPAISGVAQEGETLSASTGTWTESPTSYAYQWKRAGADISGAASSAYALTPGDVGAAITVEVMAANSAGSAAAVSDPTEAVLPLAPTSTAAPVITGTALQGQTLTVTPGSYTRSPTVTRQWRRGGVAIAGATGLTYRLGSADVGAMIDCLETAFNAGGAIAVESNDLGPVAALTTDATYPASEAVGTKLSALGWTPALGPDCIETNGLGVFRKLNSSPASMIVYLEAGAGAKHQTCAADILVAATTTYIGVLASIVNGQVEGYFLRRSSATSGRLARYDGGVQAQTWSVSLADSAPMKLEATVLDGGAGSVSLKIYQNGVQVGSTITDTSANQKRLGRVAVMSNTASSVAQLFDNIVTHTDTYVGGTGVADSVTVRMGYATDAGAGAMEAAKRSLGLLVSGDVAAWAFQRVSGDATAWPASVTTGLTPAPSRALTSADGGTSAVYKVVLDGVDTGKTYTVNVQPASETEPAKTVARQADINALAKASLGGKIVEFLDGCADSWTVASPPSFDGFTTHTGVFKVKSSPGMAKAIPRLRILKSARIHVDQCRIEAALPAPFTEGGWDGGSGWSNNQNVGLVTLESRDGVGCDEITVTRCIIGAPAAAADPTQWYTGIAIAGGFSGQHTNIRIGASATDTEVWAPDYASLTSGGAPLSQGNVIRRVKDGIAGGNFQNVIIRGNAVTYYCSNAHFFGGEQVRDLDVWDFFVTDGFKNPSDPGDHRDALQFGSTSASADYERIRCRRGVILLGENGDSAPQAPFFNDVVEHSPVSGGGPVQLDHPVSSTHYITGNGGGVPFKHVDHELSNILSSAGTPHPMTANPGNWTVKNCTLMRPLPGAFQDQLFDGAPKFNTLKETAASVTPGAEHPCTGTMDRVAAHSFVGVPIMTKTNGFSYDQARGGPLNSNSVAAHNAYYGACGFADPDSTDLIARAYPTVNGALKLGDGSYVGCFNPDGTWADGTAS